MLTLFIWTGMIIWALIALALASLLLFLLSRVAQATVNMWAQVARARKRGVPRERWNASPAQAWCDAFWHGSWPDAWAAVQRARGPVTPWQPGERKGGFGSPDTWFPGG